MPTPALLLSIATLLPLVSFLILVFAGKRIGNPLSGWIATFFIGASFIFSIIAWATWLSHGGLSYGAGIGPIILPLKWIPIGHYASWAGKDGFLNLGLHIDSLTILMFAMVTFVS